MPGPYLQHICRHVQSYIYTLSPFFSLPHGESSRSTAMTQASISLPLASSYAEGRTQGLDPCYQAKLGWRRGEGREVASQNPRNLAWLQSPKEPHTEISLDLAFQVGGALPARDTCSPQEKPSSTSSVLSARVNALHFNVVFPLPELHSFLSHLSQP